MQVCGEWEALRTLCGGGPGPDGVEEEGRRESRTPRCVPAWEPAAKLTRGQLGVGSRTKRNRFEGKRMRVV